MKQITAPVQTLTKTLAKTLRRSSLFTFVAVTILIAVLLVVFSLYRERYYEIPAINSPTLAPVYPRLHPEVILPIRKRVSDLTAAEKKAFINALKVLKTTIPRGSEISLYDQLVLEHVLTMGFEWFGGSKGAAKVDPAHGMPAFLPWHRQFLRQFEQALQNIDATVTVPYWDWTDPKELEVILQNDFLGPSGQGETVEIPGAGSFKGGTVSSGLFTNWTLNEKLHFDPISGVSLGTKLKRFIKVPPCDRYPIPKAAIEQLFSFNNYEIFNALLEGADVLNQSNRFIEGWALHAYIHTLIGGSLVDNLKPTDGIYHETQALGTMGSIPSSPYDPIFWLNHANVDRLWAEWQDQGHTSSRFYPSAGMPFGHNLHDPMWPWDGGRSTPGHAGTGEIASLMPKIQFNKVTPEDVLNFRKLGYRYDTTPS
jgi:tyrosinase